MLGQLLDRRYQVLKVLGAGGFSQTYVAEDTRRPGNPQCVVKHLKPANSDPNFLETAGRLFKKEAEALEKLGEHPQIPRLLAYFEANQEFYLVQELIEGNLLSAELFSGQRWNENQVVQLLQEILKILEFVHSKGAIHRDVKPNNIIRRQQDRKLVLVDFGIVKEINVQLATAQSQMSASIAVGTVGYMPSEQARGKPRFNSDIYALGIIAILALTGLSILELKEDASGEIDWQSRAQVSDRLAAIINKMVRYDFRERFQTATEALAALQFTAPAGYATTQLDPRPRYSQTQLATYPATTPARYPTPAPSGQQGHSTIPNSPSGQPLHPVLPTSPPSPDPILQPRGVSKFATFAKSPMGITGGLAALVSIIAAFMLTLNNQDTYQRALVKARELMEKGQSKEAINWVISIDPSSPLYSQAQQLIDRSSADILKQAEKIYNELGDLNKAVILTESIPERSTTTFQKARDLRYQWKRESEANQEHLRLAKQAILEERWQDAISEANKVSSTFFWKQQKNGIVKQAKSQLEAKKPKSNNTLTVNPKTSLPQPKVTQPHISVDTKSPSQIPPSSQIPKTSNSLQENQSIEPATSLDSSATTIDTCNDSTSLSCTSDSPQENQSIEPPTSLDSSTITTDTCDDSTSCTSDSPEENQSIEPPTSLDSSATTTDTCDDSTSLSCTSDSPQENQSIEPPTSLDSSATTTDTCDDSTSLSCTSPTADNGL